MSTDPTITDLKERVAGLEQNNDRHRAAVLLINDFTVHVLPT